MYIMYIHRVIRVILQNHVLVQCTHYTYSHQLPYNRYIKLSIYAVRNKLIITFYIYFGSVRIYVHKYSFNIND